MIGLLTQTRLRNQHFELLGVSVKAAPKHIAHLAIYDWADKEFGSGIVLDMGSELGFGLQRLRGKGRCVIGLDNQIDALRFSKNCNYSFNNHYHVYADCLAVPLAAETCAGLCLVNVLHLVRDPLRLLETCWRILLPAGALLVTIPTDFNLPEAWRSPSEIEYLKRLLKTFFSRIIFPQALNNPQANSTELHRIPHESSLLTAVCYKS